jgi:CopG family nickel-responsive transcriptional regulator
MNETVRFAVSLDQNLLKDFDRMRQRQGYENRSEAVRDLIRNHLVQQEWDDKEETMGTITLVFNHHKRNLTEKLTSTQHDYHHLVVSTMHVHLDHDNCLEILAVKGPGQKIRSLSDQLISTKGVKHGKLTLTTAGKEIT